MEVSDGTLVNAAGRIQPASKHGGEPAQGNVLIVVGEGTAHRQSSKTLRTAFCSAQPILTLQRPCAETLAAGNSLSGQKASETSELSMARMREMRDRPQVLLSQPGRTGTLCNASESLYPGLRCIPAQMVGDESTLTEEPLQGCGPTAGRLPLKQETLSSTLAIPARIPRVNLIIQNLSILGIAYISMPLSLLWLILIGGDNSRKFPQTRAERRVDSLIQPHHPPEPTERRRRVHESALR